jgi:hypothetical protein
VGRKEATHAAGKIQGFTVGLKATAIREARNGKMKGEAMIDEIFREQVVNLHRLQCAIFNRLLRENTTVLVVISDHAKLEIPDSVRPKPGLRTAFEYGLDMPIQIPDLKVTDEGISATLSFNRTPCPTFVPWEAVVRFGVVPAQSTENVPPKVTRPKLTLVP